MHGRKGWKRIISPDLKIAGITPFGSQREKGMHVLRPGEFAEVRLHRQFKIPVHESGHRPLPIASTRSIAARFGVDTMYSQHRIPEIHQTGLTPEKVTLMHHGEIPLRLMKGNKITRFYFPQLTHMMPKVEI